jgi:uncharacterized protein (TIGR02145 family)
MAAIMHARKAILIGFILLLLIPLKKVLAQDRPFGTVKVDDNLFFDQTEVDVGSWLSYYTWVLNHEGQEAARKVLPDSSAIEPEVWQYIRKRTMNYIETVAAYSGQPIGLFSKKCEEAKFFGQRLPSTSLCPFLYLPITGLTYEQVVAFCEWRTVVQGKNKIIYRLPTPEEWVRIAFQCLTEQEKKVGYRDSIDKRNCPVYNFNLPCVCEYDRYHGKLSGVGKYSPDKLGVFDVWGNVSEMTSVKGIAKGGNFKLYASQCHLDSIQHYSKPTIWLGFRCIAVKIITTNGIEPHNEGIEKDTSISLEKKNISGIAWNGSFWEFMDARNGKNYQVTRIGEQVWLAQNLAYEPDSGKFWAYKNDLSYVPQFGYLYSWETAQNACPLGWHLPSKEDFETLLKAVSASGADPHSELLQTGNSGFSAIFCGLYLGKNFTPIESGTAFWSSTEKDTKNAYGLSVGSDIPSVKLQSSIRKKSGLPVRCVKNHQ